MKTTDAIKQRILELCDKNNLSLNKLGVISNLDPSTITSIFYGKSKNPTITTIKSICDGLNITLFDFFNCEIFKDKYLD